MVLQYNWNKNLKDVLFLIATLWQQVCWLLCGVKCFSLVIFLIKSPHKQATWFRLKLAFYECLYSQCSMANLIWNVSKPHEKRRLGEHSVDSPSRTEVFILKVSCCLIHSLYPHFLFSMTGCQSVSQHAWGEMQRNSLNRSSGATELTSCHIIESMSPNITPTTKADVAL